MDSVQLSHIPARLHSISLSHNAKQEPAPSIKVDVMVQTIMTVALVVVQGMVQVDLVDHVCHHLGVAVCHPLGWMDHPARMDPDMVRHMDHLMGLRMAHHMGLHMVHHMVLRMDLRMVPRTDRLMDHLTDPLMDHLMDHLDLMDLQVDQVVFGDHHLPTCSKDQCILAAMAHHLAQEDHHPEGPHPTWGHPLSMLHPEVLHLL